MVGRSSMPWPDCGASTPVTAAAKSPRRSRGSWRPWTTPRRSTWGIPAPMNWRTAWRRSRRQGLDHVFFGNSGSEAVDTALKIAIGYHAVRGEARRTRIVGRVRGYNGVSFAGISVGGIAANRKMWSGTLLPNVDHLPHTHDLARNAFSRGLPQHGVELANELEKIIALQDASTIAAVIVEPIAGSTGVLLPPVGYLQRLRDICTKHGILLIFDEVITGFGRTGSPFAAQEFGITPDIITCAKGLTNGCVPMGAAIVSKSHLRGLHEGSGWHRDLPRLHLLGPSDRLRRGPGHPGHLCARESADPRQDASPRNGKRPRTHCAVCRM